MKKLILISLLFTVLSCTKSDEDSFKYSLGKNVIGKWDISNSAKKYNSCNIYSIVFSRTDYTINYNNGQLKGVYTVDSETQITLLNVGLISNISVSDSNISFDISIDECSKSVSGLKDIKYIDGECSTFLECNDDKYFYFEYEEGYIDFTALKFNNDPTGDLWEEYIVTYENCYEYSYFTDNGNDRNRELIENEIDYFIYKRTYLKGENVGKSYYVKMSIEPDGSLLSIVSELGASLVDGDFGPVGFFQYYLPASNEDTKTFEELVLGTYTICP